MKHIVIWILWVSCFQVYDTNEGRFLYSIDHLNEIKSMDISSNDKLLATTSFRFNDEVMLLYK